MLHYLTKENIKLPTAVHVSESVLFNMIKWYFH